MNITQTLAIPEGFVLTTEQFEQLASVEQLAKIELTPEGILVIMSPTGGEAGRKNSQLTTQVTIWANNNNTGEVFDSSTIFALPDGSRRSPDVSWVEKTRWEALTTEQQEGYPPLAPDFVIELVSPSDLKNQRYEDLQAKMQEYLKNEVKLGWLIEPKSKTVEIYRLGRKVEKLENPSNLSGEDVLINFSLDLSKIFV
ncbi:MAG: Uma2 family endonuclease [Waterburya sp.]